MSSHVLSITGFLPASPLAKGERIEVRGSLILIIKLANPHPTLSQAHSLLTGASASVSPSGREKGEAEIPRII
jgi:hypothetical protein